MDAKNTPRKPSLPVVPVSFLALIVLCALLFWWLRPPGVGVAGGMTLATRPKTAQRY